MSDFLVMPNGVPEHYFYKVYEGICVRRRNAYHTWQEHTSVFQGAGREMGVFADDAGRVHIICQNKQGELVYLVQKNNIWKRFTISRLPKEIKIKNMRLYSVSARLNFLASALYNGEHILIHCILGDHAKPSVAAVLEDGNFIISGDRVYFTTSQGCLGYLSLNDEKPAGFTRLYDDAHSVYVKREADREFVIFTRNSKLYINDEEILYDSRIENPIMVTGDSKIYVMWKSGGFIRYITSFNGGTTWSAPMRFISSGANATLFVHQHGNNFDSYYGYSEENNIMLLGSEDIFSKKAGVL